MKRLLILPALFLGLLSCRTQKSVTTTDRNTVQSYVDTTQTAVDTSALNLSAIDTTKTAAAFEGSQQIEFVEGGGKVYIDSAGNITLDGVINIKSHGKGSVAQDKGVAQQIGNIASHREQAKGINAKQTDQQKQTEEKAPARKWYETTLARLGLGVCIAALLWVLFLYLRRRL